MTDNDQAEAVINGLGEPEHCECPSTKEQLFKLDQTADYTYAICNKCRGWLWRYGRLPIYTTGA